MKKLLSKWKIAFKKWKETGSEKKKIKKALKNKRKVFTNKTKEENSLISRLRDCFLLNELGTADYDEAFSLKLARTRNSGCTFGLCQFDVSVNSKAKEFSINNLSLSGSERAIFFNIKGKDYQKDTNGKIIKQDSFEHLSAGEKRIVGKINFMLKSDKNIEMIKQIDNARLEILIAHTRKIFSTDKNDSQIIHLADMANQFGFFSPNGSTVMFFKELEELTEKYSILKWQYFSLNKNEDTQEIKRAFQLTKLTCDKVKYTCNLSCWLVAFLFFKFRTKHGRRYPEDVARRWKNIITNV